MCAVYVATGGKQCGPSITDADEVWLRRKVKRISKIQKIARCIMLGQIHKTGKHFYGAATKQKVLEMF